MSSSVTTVHYTSWKARITSPFIAFPHAYAATSAEDIEVAHNALRLASTELNDLERSIQLLNDEKEALQKLIGTHRISLRPISRIAPETWIQIFKLACESYLEGFSPYSHSVSWGGGNPVAKFSRVCSSWRSALRACPQMWTSLYFGGSGTWTPEWMSAAGRSRYAASPFEGDMLNRLKGILDLSKAQPLRISYGGPKLEHRVYCGWARPFVEDTLRMLAGHHRRWKMLDLYETFEVSASQLSACITQCGIQEFPALEELNVRGDVSFHREYEFTAFYTLIDLLGRLPSLRRVYFSTTVPRPAWPPWNQLECIELDKIRSVQWYNIRPFLLSAIKISIPKMDRPWEYNSPQEPYTLPSLEIFSLDRWMNKHLGLLIAPRLRELEVKDIRFEDLPQIIELIRRSQCKITRFSCGTIPHIHRGIWSRSPSSQDEHITHLILYSLPDLQTLEIKWYQKDDVGETERLIQALSQRSCDLGPFLFCPDLRHLRLGSTFFNNAPEDRQIPCHVVDLIKARWENRTASEVKGGGLRAVGCFPTSLSRHYEEELRVRYERMLTEMEKEGLEVEWRHRTRG